MSGLPNDADRLTQAVREHGQAVFGFLVRSVRNHALADDLTQDVFYRAWRKRESYQETGQQRAYLLQIAARLVRDHYRRKPMLGLVDADGVAVELVDTSQPTPIAKVAQSETERELNEALSALTPPQRQALLLRYYGNHSFEEIAQTMCMPLSTALSHARRGLLALRKLLVEES